MCFSGYVTDILEDAKVYSSHASKKNIDVEDVKLAVQCKLDHAFTNPPPREVECELYSEVAQFFYLEF